MKYLFITLCVIFSCRMVAQENPLSDTKDWFADEENIHCGCSYVRSSQGTKMAVLYYSIKENEEKEGIKYSKMFVNVVELAELQGGIHEMVYIDDEYPNGQTCTDVLLIWQDGNKVYCQSEDGKQKWLILDFGLKTGDTFVNGIGEHYLVKETTNSDDSKRKKLLLISEDGTQEDIWEEGIGSLNWGFLPDYVVKTLKYFRDSDEKLFANLWAAGIAPNYFMEQSVNDEYFKLQPFDEVKDDEAENMTFNDLNYPLSLNYSFIGDNLLIQGYYPLNYYPCFVAASISGANIDITLHQITTLNKIKGMHVAKIDVRIPGFSAGTYEIGLNGNKTQTVVCPGANGGTFLAQGTAWVDGFGYEQDGQFKLDDVKLFYYTTAGDTLINDKSYFRIRCTKRCMTSYKLDLDDEGNEYVREKSLYTDDGGLYFFMREDESGDVWFYTEDKNVFEEISHNTLYNDFNVADDLVSRDLFLFNAKKEYAVGDALPLGVIVFDSPNGYKEGEGFWDVYPYEVKGIDEMNMIDGKIYKRYNKYFLEGIGPLDGPLVGIGRPNSLNADVNQLFAFYKNGQLVYRNEGYLSALEELFPNILDILTGDKPNDSVLHNHPKYYQDGDYWVQALVPWNFEEHIHDYETEGAGRNFPLYFFYVEGDTIIDNKEYKCVHAKTWKYDCEETYDHQPEGLVEGKQIPNVLFMREDADGRQWRRLATLSEEALLFDFSCPFEKGQKIRYCRHENLDDVLETLSYEVKAYSTPFHHRGIKAELSDEAPEGYYYYDLETSNVGSIDLPNGEQVPFANGRIAFGWGDVYQGDLFHQLSPLCEGSEGMFLYRVHQGQVILQNKNNVIKINDIIGKDVLSLFNKPMDANTYFPTGMKWKEVPAEPDYPLDTLYAVTWEIGPDTIINNLNYKQIIRDGKTINIWIRENAGKIWLMTEEYPRELLLYNFNWVPDEVLYTEYIRETDNGMEVFRDEFTVNDYKTTKCGNHTYQYIFNDEFATIRGIGRVSDLNKNSGLLGYRKMKEILPGLIYSKVLWINRNNEEIFRSEIAEEWTCEIPTDTNQNVPVSYTKDQMATIILPTTPDASKGKYYGLDRCEEGKIIFTEERDPKARTPYIIVPNEDFIIDLNKLELESLLNDTVSVKGAMFIGSYNSAEMNCQEGFYIDIIDTTPDCQIIGTDQRKAAIGALRAYLVAPWDDPYAQGGSRGVTEKREIVLRDNPNDIESIHNSQFIIHNDDAIYDLQGRRLSGKPAKGLYIQNGVKRVVR